MIQKSSEYVFAANWTIFNSVIHWRYLLDATTRSGESTLNETFTSTDLGSGPIDFSRPERLDS